MKSYRILSLALLLSLAFKPDALAADATLTVQTDKPGAKINPAMWGIFFEDINLGADGGLYAELVKNRAFEFPNPMMGWIKLTPSKSQGSITIRDEKPFNPKNPHYVRVESRSRELIGIANEGFRGIGVKAGESYNFTAQVRAASGNSKLRVELYSEDGSLLDSVRLEKFSPDWQKISATLKPKATDARAKIYLLVDGAGALDFDMVSLFPQNTWKQRPGGLRADMVQKLADLKPGFMRFPGGCIVEGIYLTNRYQWKKTLGPIEERETMLNRWNVEFLHRPTPDYFQSFGLGFFEYFQLCEDIGTAPMPILSCGVACQFNSGETCPLDELDSYIQDAIDLIEFANGSTNTIWGAKRAAMGHPAPFNMTMLGVGNENWQQPYIERYAKFHAALKEKHPEIQLISSAGPGVDNDHFNFAWPRLRELKADIVDEHTYARPDWFFDNANRFDAYQRIGPKVFFGEYAAQSDRIASIKNRNNLETAISEAAFMTGMERNADVVVMASYAPLFAHIDGWQWTPNLIWVDNLSSYGTPNYYVQKLFANHRGDIVIPVKLESAKNKRLFASATRDESAKEIIVKLVNGHNTSAEVNLNMSGPARIIVLGGADRASENTFAEPTKISPVESDTTLATSTPFKLPANSLTVLRVKAKN